MIRVNMKAEPDSFDLCVRQPGNRFLGNTPAPTAKEFEKHPYWRSILRELREAYNSVCAYCSFYVPPATGVDTVEHFKPKSKHPNLAYEWSNYRFVSHRLNSRKGARENVLDPFEIENGWFVIEFPSLLVKPAANLSNDVERRVEMSIAALGLNDPATCLQQREDYTEDYCKQFVTYSYLQKDAPFLAAEIDRQGLVGRLNDVMGYSIGQK